MALPSFQAAGAWASSTSAPVSPAWPAHVAGDVALLIVKSSGWGINLSVDAGFKEIPVSPRWASPAFPSGSTIQVNAFWCRATGAAMGAPTVEFTPRYGTGFEVNAIIITFRGCGSGHPWNLLSGADSYEAATGTLTLPGGVTTDPDTLFVPIIGIGGTSGSPTISSVVNSSLTAITQRAFNSTANGAIGVYTGAKAAAGAANDTVATISIATRRLAGLLLALTGVDKSNDPTPYIAGCGEILESAVGNVSPAWPAGHRAGDIGILLIQSGGYPLTLGTPAGFTELPNSPQSSTTSGVDGLASLHAYWKRATTGAEPAPTVDFHTSVIKAGIFIIRGAPGSGNFWDASAGDVATPATTSVAWPGVTVNKANSLVLFLMAHGNDSTSRTIDPAGLSNANLIDRRIWAEFVSNVGPGAALLLASAKAASAGAIGSTTATMDGGQQQARITLSVPPPVQVAPSDGGVFSFTGQPANLLHGRKILAEQGAFSFTGQDSTLSVRITRREVSDTGFFSFEGQPSELKRKKGKWEHRNPANSVWTKKPPV